MVHIEHFSRKKIILLSKPIQNKNESLLFRLVILLRASNAEIVMYHDLVTHIFHGNVYIFQKSLVTSRVDR